MSHNYGLTFNIHVCKSPFLFSDFDILRGDSIMPKLGNHSRYFVGELFYI